jgi:hypothetical protein
MPFFKGFFFIFYLKIIFYLTKKIGLSDYLICYHADIVKYVFKKMTSSVSYIQSIEGLQISQNKKSERIIDIELKDVLVDKLIFPFHKFDITALEYKPFTRFTIAKSLDDLTENKLSKFLNLIIRDRKIGCAIFKTNNNNKKINDQTILNKI